MELPIKRLRAATKFVVAKSAASQELDLEQCKLAWCAFAQELLEAAIQIQNLILLSEIH